ncbi:isopentenyl-diphosphate delta-isomerase [Candidatus Gottesmanbacteria bacterium RIFCSPHIGHO2_12_FULL_40_13]|uniref:Isopentenyl-diphosphate delta-isomerase n=1 Tax=Candidatus Gottesmanbacteria bacterium RIFCSPHIGHO2_01_FULL_40_15 TaxID=1798376 RepID=A0A1F5YZX7_9BACT|nr:MAG: isopentenyl-diphosphate delta-isomerase [Candidatus Gottesmanbacteria bacterium RIFCSPHIGHO2_01_FULL_40_15]OGG24852.1 MAG: isopentenyl-diphosphate delta-isomerase [Candidatus Gottesmanbacteria bacterium RIFCSPHIGHO2_12_FULL_40_13]
MKNTFQFVKSGEKKGQLLITCDNKGNPNGTATRFDCHRGNGITHLAFMAFLLDEKNNLVLTKRAGNKSLWPGFWDTSVVSHVLPGETPKQAALRRSKEELAVSAEFKIFGEFYYQARQNDQSENEYCYLLSGKTEQKVIPNQVEISEIKIVNSDAFSEFYKRNLIKFTPWFNIALKKYNLEKIIWQKNIKPSSRSV